MYEVGSEPEQFPIRFGPFLLLRLLGAGGMGSAYLARHAKWDGYLVVKRLHPHFMEDQTIFKRFIHEAKVATYVRHANVTPLVAMGTVGKEPFFATDFVFGIAFSDLLDRIEKKMSEALPYELILRIGIGAAKGLEAIHQAVDVETGRSLELIHRDIGSRNLLLGFDGQTRIIDLGLGKSVFADWQTAAGIFAGSPDYMPPEQALGHKVDRRGDVYALAVTLWELIVGRKRIRESTVAQRITRAIEASPEPVRAFREEVSLQLEEALQKCMDPSPEQRLPQVADLTLVMEHELVRIKKSPQREDVVKWLDTACATVLAKERRLLRQLDELSVPFDLEDRDLQETEYLVAQPIIFMPLTKPLKESVLAIPTPWFRFVLKAESSYGALLRWWAESSKRSRRLLMGIGTTILTLLILILGNQADDDPPNAKQIPGVEFAEPRKVKTSSPKKDKANPRLRNPSNASNRKLRQERLRNRRPQIDSSFMQRRAGFVARIRVLRRKRFDVQWQKRLTKLSGLISASKTKQSLDEIELKIRKLEKEVD